MVSGVNRDRHVAELENGLSYAPSRCIASWTPFRTHFAQKRLIRVTFCTIRFCLTQFLPPMSTPLQRIKQGAVSLAAIFVLAVLGYRTIAGFSWMKSVWMVVITVSTVGYGEDSTLPSEVQLLTIAVILLGVSASAYTFGSLLQYFLEGEFDRVLGNRMMTKEITKLSQHVIVCGYGRLGEDLANMLSNRHVDFVVVDNDPDRTEEVREHKRLAVTGDATVESVLEEANLSNARAIVTTLPTDAENVFIALTARNLKPDILIIAIAERPSSCKKLRQAGANKIVMPHRVGAQTMERILSRPTTADLFDLFAEASEQEMELDEYFVPPATVLVGKSVGESGMRDVYDLLVIGVKKMNGELIFNPSHSVAIEPEDTLMVIGKLENIQRMKKESSVIG